MTALQWGAVLAVNGLLAAALWRSRTVPIGLDDATAEAVCTLIRRHAVPGAVIDLGSGWGGLALRLALRFPDRAVTGWEMLWLPALASRLLRRPNLRFRRGDYLAAPLAGAAVLVCYTSPAAMALLAGKLRREPAPGRLLVSARFPLPGFAAIDAEGGAFAYAA